MPDLLTAALLASALVRIGLEAAATVLCIAGALYLLRRM